MFGLTRREQRWKAEQKAAETLVQFATAIVRARADVEVAVAARERDAEVAHLRAELAELKARLPQLLPAHRQDEPKVDQEARTTAQETNGAIEPRR